MINLLAETVDAITDSGHTPADIIFIGDPETGYECSWDEFRGLADFDYDDGYGSAQIPGELRVVFSDGSDMHRGEYDGSEWWEFSKPFVRPAERKQIRTLRGHLWHSLADINESAESPA